jgi:glycerol uptake facilitator-like aquaporin
MGARLSHGDDAITLLVNSLATGASLVALILAVTPASGAHFNPLVTLIAAFDRQVPWQSVPLYLVAQFSGACAGVALANVMFGLSVFSSSTRIRGGAPQLLSEFVATFGLLTVISFCSRLQSISAPYAVAAYITAAYWFTSSTSFANPAVTIARSATDTFAGIRPTDVGPFVVAQLCGAVASAAFVHWMKPVFDEKRAFRERNQSIETTDPISMHWKFSKKSDG